MATPEIQALLSNPANFEVLVTQLLLSDNTARKHAEDLFEQLKEHPDACVSHLIYVLRQSASLEHKSFASIMLRKVLTSGGEGNLWEKSSPNVQALVKTELLHSLKTEQDKSVLHKVCDTTADVAGTVLDKGPWPELLPFLLECIQSSQPLLMESALTIFRTLLEYNFEHFAAHMRQIHQLLLACLQHPSLDVQLASFKAAVAAVQASPSAKERDALQDLLPHMLGALGRILQAGDETGAQEALDGFIEIAGEEPRYLRKQLQELAGAMLQICAAESLEPGTREMAVELLLTLCEAREKAPVMMKKLPGYVSKIFEATMHFLLDVEDDPLWHNADSEQHEDDGNGELYDFGQECLDRLSNAMGGAVILPAAAQLLPAWLGDADWRRRHAVLICLAQIAEGCAEEMGDQLAALTEMCIKGLQDPSAKVRWAACQALGQMCTDLGPELQDACHATILPALMAVMDDFSNPRVQAHASAAIVNFSENSKTDLIQPYLDQLISRLITLLQQGQRMVQEGALTALASVADCAQEAFIKYYDHVMPLLAQICFNATDKTLRLLRAKALECISLVGMAVGKDKFRTDAQHVMHFLQQLHMTELDADDPTAGYVLQAGARLCKCLGDEFLPYLPITMPYLIKSASAEPDVQVRDQDDEGDDDDDDDLERIELGDKVLMLRTSVMEEKATALSMLSCYAEELKAGFFPYVKEVTDLVVPLLKFYWNDEVRRCAAQSIPELIKSAIAALEAKQTDAALVKTMLDFVWTPLANAIGKEPDVEVMAALLTSVEEIVDAVDKQFLSEPMVHVMFERFKVLLEQCEERRRERINRQLEEEFDADEAAALEDEAGEEEEKLDLVTNCVQSFLKKFGDGALPFVEMLMPLVSPLLSEARATEERRIGICLVDDVLEYSQLGRHKYTATIMPILLRSCADRHADLRQCATYGVGVIASKSPDLFKPFCNEALQRTLAIITAPDARTEDNAMATDNAVSTLGKIVQHHADTIDSAAALEVWVNALPLKADFAEAEVQHSMLVKLLEQQDPRLLGPANKNLPKIVSTLVEVLARGHQLADKETVSKMVALLHTLRPAVPTEVLAQVFASLNPKQQQKLQQLTERSPQ